jgi:cell division protein FtsL
MAKLKAIFIVLVIFGLGLLILSRYALIMEMHSQALSMKQTLEENKKENEDLQIQLMTTNNIRDIERVAIKELGMVKPNSSNTVYISVPKEITKGNKEQVKNNNNIIANLYNKLKDLFGLHTNTNEEGIEYK